MKHTLPARLCFPDIMLSLFAAFAGGCCLGVAEAVLRGAVPGSETFSRAVSLPLVLLCTVVLFLLLLVARLLCAPRFLQPAVLCGFLFALAAMQLTAAFSVPLYTVFCALLLVGYLLLLSTPAPRGLDRLPSYLPALCALLIYVILTGTVCILRVVTYTSPCFDFAIFSQMFHSMRTDLSQTVTCERNTALSHFAVHVSPVYYLLLPLYALFPSPLTLAVSQVLIVAAAAVPMALLCRHLGFSKRITALLAAMLLLFPALSAGCMYDMHENCFLTLFLLFLFYFIERRSPLGILLFGVLTVTVKEDAPVYVAFAALYLLCTVFRMEDKRTRRRMLCTGGVLLLFAIAYFVTVTTLLQRFGLGVMTTRYQNLSGEGGSLLDVIVVALKNPTALLTAAVDSGEKLGFFLELMLPLAALPLLTRKWERLILLCPMILINFLSDYVYQHDLFFQYHFGVAAFLLYAAALNLRDMKPRLQRCIPPFAMLCALLLLIGIMPPKLSYIGKYQESAAEFARVTEILRDIPEEASVSASTCYCTMLSARKTLYVFDKYERDYNTDYIVLDIRYANGENHYDNYIINEDYTLSAYVQNYIAVFRRVTPNNS